MSKDTCFTQYDSPNIVIVPTISFDKSLVKPDADNKSSKDDNLGVSSNNNIPILIQRTPSNETCMDGKNKYTMNPNQNNAKMCYTHNIIPTVSTQPDIHYSNHENNTGSMDYSHVCQTNEIGVSMPLYHGPYGNENNDFSYFYGQPLGYPTYYDSTTGYLSTFSHPSGFVGHNARHLETYYPNASSSLIPNNIPTCSYTCINKGNTMEPNDFDISMTDNNNKPTTFLEVEEKKETGACCGITNTSTKLLEANKQTETTAATKLLYKKKCCDCMCSKVNLEEEIDCNEKFKNKSSVKVNEKAFQNLLKKLEMGRKPESKKKQTISTKTSGKGTTLKPPKKTKSKKQKNEKSSAEQNEKAFQIFLQKWQIEKELTLRKSGKKRHVKKKAPSKDTSSILNTKAFSVEENSKSNVAEEEERPKFIKTKYVDDQEPEYKTKVRRKSIDYTPSISLNLNDVSHSENKKYSVPNEKEKPKFIKTKYVDEQEPEYKPIKKPRISTLHDITKYPGTTPSYFKPKRSRNELESSEKVNRDNNKISKTDSKYIMCRLPNTETWTPAQQKTQLKSVIKYSQNLESLNKSRYSVEKKDLRDTLSRKLHKTSTKLKIREHELLKRKSPGDSSDNLVITLNNNIDKNKSVPDKSKDSHKKINLVINILYKEPETGSGSESDKSDSSNHSLQKNVDLSFLDDFNVDEIVDSLNKSEKIGTRPISEKGPNDMLSKDAEKNGTSNVLQRIKNTDMPESGTFGKKEDFLNDLLSKEANLLDSHRILNQEIHSQNHCTKVNEADNEKYNLSQKECAADTLLKEIQDAIKKNVAEDPTSDLPLGYVAEHIKDKQDTHNIISQETEDKIGISELLRILEGSPDDINVSPVELQIKNETAKSLLLSTTDQQNKVEDEEYTLIDISDEESNDKKDMNLSQQTNLSQKSSDDVYIVEVPKKDYETIDLTTDENTNISNVNECSLSQSEITSSSKQNKARAKLNKSIDKANYGIDIAANKESSTENITMQDPQKEIKESKIVSAIEDPIVIELEKSINRTIGKESPVKIARLSEIKANAMKDTVIGITVNKNKKINIDMEYNSSVSIKSSNNVSHTARNNSAMASSVIVAPEDIEKDKESNKTLVNDASILSTKNKNDTEEENISGKQNKEVEKPIASPPEIQTRDLITNNRSKEMKDNSSITKMLSENVKISAKEDIKTVSETISSPNERKEKDNEINNVESQQQENKSKDKLSKAQTVTQSKPGAPTIKAVLSNSITQINTVKKEKASPNTVNIKPKDDQSVTKPCQENRMTSLSNKLARVMSANFKEKYIVKGLIHAGKFSKVFHCQSNGREYAVKSLNHWKSIYNHADKEDMLFAMQRGTTRDSHGCVYVLNSFSLKGHLCFIMDYYPKNLQQALLENEKPFHINVVQHLARQLVSAVMMLKSHGILHLDIKPSHILLNLKNDTLKLSGFDEACYIDNILEHNWLGSVNYRPPEVIIGYKVGFDADVWATGLVLHEMATNIKLFPGRCDNDILYKQMCTLGALPVEMIHRSRFAHGHFTGSSFRRVMGTKLNKFNFITKFLSNKRLETSVMKAYNANWRANASEGEVAADEDKILTFIALLREMLEVNPNDRIPIQFVNGSPFITDEC